MASLLKMGSSGSQVRRLQELLDQKGYALEADGIFGEKTRAAVLNYQRENQLAVDGIVGDATWASLETQIPPQAEVPEAEIPFEEKNTAQRLEMYENEVPEFRESEALSILLSYFCHKYTTFRSRCLPDCMRRRIGSGGLMFAVIRQKLNQRL